MQSAAILDTSGTSATPNALGVAATPGNLLISTINLGGNTDPNFQTPAGWRLGRIKIDLLSTGGVGAVFYKIADGNDRSPLITWTGSLQLIATLAEYAPTTRFLDNPLDTFVSADNSGLTAAASVTGGVTRQIAETVFAFFFGSGSVTLGGITGGFTLRDALASTGGAGATKANLMGTLDKFATDIVTPVPAGTLSGAREWAGIVLGFMEAGRTTGGFQ